MQQFVLGGSVQRSIHSATARLMKFVLVGALLTACSQIGLAQTAHFGSFEKTIVSSGLKTPNGIAVDAGGNVYIPDTWNHRVLKETLSGGGYVQTTIGSGWQEPHEIAVDASGNLYVVDTGLTAVIKETATATGYTQSTIGSGFNQPEGIAVDTTGNLYIADTLNNQVVKETLSGATYTASVIVTGLNSPGSIAVDTAGNLYIADTNNKRVLKETLSNGAYTQTQMNCPGLDMPYGIAVDLAGNVYIADTYENRVLLEAYSAGSYTQSVIPTSKLYYAYGVAVDPNGNIYIADTDNGRVIEETLSGVNFGSVNVASNSASQMLSFVFDTSGTLGSIVVRSGGITSMDFASAGTGTCKAGTAYAAAATCTVNVTFTPQASGARMGAVVLQNTGGTPIATAYIYGTGVGPQVNFLPSQEVVIASAGLNSPNGPVVDAAGNVYFADYSNNRVVKLTLASGTYTQSTIGSGMNEPGGVAMDGSGNLYVSDTENFRVLKETLTANGYVQSVLPTPGLSYPYGVAVDGNGNVYITDTTNNRILKETVTPGGYSQSAIGTGLHYPYGVAVDGGGNLYIADTLNSRIVKESLASGGYTQSVVDSNVSVPYGIAVDGNGNIFVADTFNRRVIKDTPENGVYVQSLVATSALSHDYGIAVDASGNIYVTDTLNNRILMENLGSMPALAFPTTAVGATSATQTITVQNIGNAPLSFPVPTSGNNPSVAANFTVSTGGTSDCPQVSAGATGAGTLAAGSSCLLPVNFEPTVAGSISGSVVLTSNSLNAVAPNYSKQSASLGGAATPGVPSVSWSAPAAIVYGAPLSTTQLNATASTPGKFIYTPAAGTVLGAGTHTLSCTFTPTDTADYTTATESTTLTVTQATPVIAWNTPASVYANSTLSATQLNATASVPGTFTYSPAAGSVVTTGVQTLTVTFTPTDTTDYATAKASVTLTVNPTTVGPAFGGVNIGTTSAVQAVHVTFTTAGKLGTIAVLTQGKASLDFASVSGGTCVVGNSYAAGATCTVNVNFTPRASGSRLGAVVLQSSTGAALATSYVNGSGVGPQMSFLPGVQSTVDGSGLNRPFGVAVDGSGAIYFSDAENYRILKQTPTTSGYTTTTYNVGGWSPFGIAVDGAGNLYMADYNNSRIVKATPSGTSYVQTTIGTGLLHPYGVAVDGIGNVYIADTNNNRILKETLSATGYTQSVIPTSTLDDPYGVAVDASGNLYIADTWHNRALKETANGTGYTETVIGSGLQGPGGISVDGNGNVLIGDSYNKRIVKLTPSGATYTQSAMALSGLNLPIGVAVDGAGNAYAADFGINDVLKLDTADAPSMNFASTKVGVTSSDSPRIITVTNIGNAPLTFPVPTAGSNPSAPSSFTLNASTAACPVISSGSSTAATLATNGSCLLSISFTPVSSGTLNGTLAVKDNSLNAAAPNYVTQSLPLSGTATN